MIAASVVRGVWQDHWRDSQTRLCRTRTTPWVDYAKPHAVTLPVIKKINALGLDGDTPHAAQTQITRRTRIILERLGTGRPVSGGFGLLSLAAACCRR